MLINVGQKTMLRMKSGEGPYSYQQNVSAMVPGRVGLKFYLRSTFSFRGTGRGFERAPLQKHKRCGQACLRQSGLKQKIE